MCYPPERLLLPYSIAAYVSPLQYVAWQGERDDERVAREITAAIAGRPPQVRPSADIAAPRGGRSPGRRDGEVPGRV